MARTIVVGGGISGIACAGALNRRGQAVTLLDKGRVLGGRMASRRIRDSGTPSDGHVVDIGASYFTAQDDRFRELVERLIGLGIADLHAGRPTARPRCDGQLAHGAKRGRGRDDALAVMREAWQHDSVVA